MQKEEILHYLKEEMSDLEIDTVMKAVGEGFGRIHPQAYLVWLALPKFDPEERKNILRWSMEQIERETYDEVTGEPVIPGFGH